MATIMRRTPTGKLGKTLPQVFETRSASMSLTDPGKISAISFELTRGDDAQFVTLTAAELDSLIDYRARVEGQHVADEETRRANEAKRAERA